MPEPELAPLAPDDEFRFGCHREVPCFNHCCRDLNQALTPYDVLRLRKNLDIKAQDFFDHYAVLYPGPATGLPVASLKFTTDREKHCPFVSPEGCRVYADRPSSCRLYPLVRGLQRSRIDGSISEHYALLQEPHCRGFDQEKLQTVRQWIASQGLAEYFKMNDALMELIALKNQIRPGTLSPEHQKMTQMAFYDPNTMKKKALAGELTAVDHAPPPPLPGEKNDAVWLLWGFQWIRRLLFGEAG